MVLLGAVAIYLLAESPRPGKWEMQYFYDQNESTLTLTDLKFPSAKRGIATGFISKRVVNLLLGDHEKTEPIVLVTADGGKAWEQISVKAIAESLFFLNDTVGWMVTQEGIWTTNESGRSWKRISNLKNLNQVFFLNATHGFVSGDADRVLETNDGGITWKPIVWEAGPTPRDLKVIYRTIQFASQENGIIAGEVAPSDDYLDEMPTRMLRPRKQANAFLYTKNGGKTWRRSINSMYGEMTRISVGADGFGLALLQFPQVYPWPSEIYRMRLGTDDENHMVYRSRNRAITDVLFYRESDSYAAGYQPPGDRHPSPVPGKVRILRSANLEAWEDMAVDYRAVARQVWLASPQPEAVWAATDTGMILKLKWLEELAGLQKVFLLQNFLQFGIRGCGKHLTVNIDSRL